MNTSNIDDKGKDHACPLSRATGRTLSSPADGCLLLSLDEWVKLAKEVQNLPLAKKDARAFSRFLFSGAAEVECDKQGRVSIPSLLRDYAGIDKDVVIVGVSERIEIWAAETWSAVNDELLGKFEELAEKLEGF